MVHAFVMVTLGPDEPIEPIVEAVRSLETVQTANVVAGDVDLVVELVVDETYQVMEAVTDGIRSLEGVIDTTTYVSIG